ncbi:K(+)/H(+) antiporter NhaP2 [Candidatus Methanobinarius endosymbioticus]|uniref:K(+)/H(+) antiporter NhaP2 n=1 Tax=Candidatus Methanobinarius endosymbioticus TaxID=2006182 RepID=A0A366M8Y5_9EURY|nr:K(+)/H(+) antiporter NhaP2 [Candidatus Methanobinarius endosymbioticus]
MVLSIGMVIILGILCTKLLTRMKIPSFLGFLVIGVMLGPYALNILDHAFMGLTRELSTLAIIILLLRAGLGLSRDAMRKVGRPAVEMSFIPSVIEGVSVVFIAHYLLGISFIEAGMLGFILAAVSPAILVPRMLDLVHRGLGVAKGIPTLLLAGSAADDVVAITIFSAFLGIYTGGNINITWDLLGIPISLILGILAGLVTGAVILFAFRKWNFSNTEKLLITLATGIILNAFGEIMQGFIPVAGLVGVMVMGFLILDKNPKVGQSLSNKYSKLWMLSEIIVFVLLGAQLNLPLMLSVIGMGVIVVTLGLLFRFVGVYISLLGTDLTTEEKLFCMISYIPKANVQATIGAVPLAAGVASGELILAVTAISIIYTAPIGAILIKFFSDKLLTKDRDEDKPKEKIMVVH